MEPKDEMDKMTDHIEYLLDIFSCSLPFKVLGGM